MGFSANEMTRPDSSIFMRPKSDARLQGGREGAQRAGKNRNYETIRAAVTATRDQTMIQKPESTHRGRKLKTIR